MSTGFRLLKLERRMPRRSPPPASNFDPTRLSIREGYELDQLLAVLSPPHHGRRWDLAPLTDDELERMTELVRKAEGAAAEGDPMNDADVALDPSRGADVSTVVDRDETPPRPLARGADDSKRF